MYAQDTIITERANAEVIFLMTENSGKCEASVKLSSQWLALSN